ncbi:hypothetical protein ACS0TY_029090 [Phlomoides rotata]
MKEKLIYVNGLRKVESAPLWKWKGINFHMEEAEGKLQQVTQFFNETGRRMDDAVLGPGIGAGIGCGAGLGLGVVGGAGLFSWPWNDLRLVFGIGAGCGVGIGFGYGQGYGGGFSLESLKSHLSNPKKRVRV